MWCPLSPSTVVERNFIWNIHNKSIANYHLNNVLWSVSMQSSGTAHMPWNLGFAVHRVYPPQSLSLALCSGRTWRCFVRQKCWFGGWMYAAFIPALVATIFRTDFLRTQVPLPPRVCYRTGTLRSLQVSGKCSEPSCWPHHLGGRGLWF